MAVERYPAEVQSDFVEKINRARPRPCVGGTRQRNQSAVDEGIR